VIVDARQETLENRLLRRVDWRWLLPAPFPARSVCFAVGDLAEAVRLISRCVLTPSDAAGGTCDLAVAVAPDAAQLRAAYDALSAGGWCYSEWHSPLDGGLNRIRAQVESAGFEPPLCYWPRMGLHLPSAWMPVLASGAAAAAHVGRMRAAGRGHWRIIVERLLRLVLRLGVVRPLCVLARKGGGEGDALPALIRANWAAWGLGPTPDRLSCVLLTGGPGSTNKVVGLLFAEPSPTPRLVIKMARTEQATDALRQEARALDAIGRRHAGGVPGVPHLLFSGVYAGRWMLGQSVVSGRPLYTRLTTATYRELALQTTDWLIALASHREVRAPDGAWRRVVESRLDEFEACFVKTVDRGLLRATRRCLAHLGELSLVPEQRDLWTGNLLLDDDGQLGVVDWEDAQPQGLPAVDLVYFLTDLAFMHARAYASGQFRPTYRATLDPATFVGCVRAECLTRYAAGIGLDPAALRPLSVLTWLPNAVWEKHHPAAALPRFLQLWEEDLRADGATACGQSTAWSR
jgi:hypothetical protein